MTNHNGDGLVLAKRFGQYRELAPIAPLQGHFRCAWMHAIPAGHAGRPAVVPDGCVDLVWSEGCLMVAGPDISAALPTLAPGATVLGMRFRPGAAANWLALPMSEIVGSQVDLADILGPRGRQLCETIGDADTPSEAMSRFQAGLQSIAATVDGPARDMELVFRALGKPGWPGGSRIPLLRDRIGMSEQTLRRRCHQHFGYGPKTLDRILRFQRFLSLAGRSPRHGMSALSFEAGYADQAHLSREVLRLTGLSPTTVVQQLAD